MLQGHCVWRTKEGASDGYPIHRDRELKEVGGSPSGLKVLVLMSARLHRYYRYSHVQMYWPRASTLLFRGCLNNFVLRVVTWNIQFHVLKHDYDHIITFWNKFKVLIPMIHIKTLYVHWVALFRVGWCKKYIIFSFNLAHVEWHESLDKFIRIWFCCRNTGNKR